jgi:hypothetical protein
MPQDIELMRPLQSAFPFGQPGNSDQNDNSDQGFVAFTEFT